MALIVANNAVDDAVGLHGLYVAALGYLIYQFG